MQTAFGLPYGTLKVAKAQFLKRQNYDDMLKLSSTSEFIFYLEDHGYGPDFSGVASEFKDLDLLEASNNRHIAKTNRFALSVTPNNGKDLIVSYLTKWDIQNIKTILVSKNLNQKIEQTELRLVSEKNSGIGMYAGLLDYNDYRNILAMDKIEDVISYTLKFGYGKVLLSYLDEYRKTGDLSGLLLSLDLYYYDMMKDKFRFYSGSEGPFYRFIKKSIDLKNIMTILKFIEHKQEQNVGSYIISGGSFSAQWIDDLVKSDVVEDVVQKLKGYSNLSKGLDFYKRRGSLLGIEGELNRNLYWEFMETFEMSSLSINNIIAYLLRAEAEWKDVRNLVFSRFYRIDDDTIKMTSINLG